MASCRILAEALGQLAFRMRTFAFTRKLEDVRLERPKDPYDLSSSLALG